MEQRFNLHKIETRKAENGDQTLSGYAAVFDSPSCDLGGFTEFVKRGAFKDTLKNDVQKALWNHISDHVLGSTRSGTLKLWEDETGLAFELKVPNTQAGRDVFESVSRGDVDGNSFGFNIEECEWDEKDAKNIRCNLTKVRLVEISPTPFPAYGDTSIGIRSAYEKYKKDVVPNYDNEKRKLQIMQMED